MSKQYYLYLSQYYAIKAQTTTSKGWKTRYKKRQTLAYSRYLKYDEERLYDFENLMKSIKESKVYSTQSFDMFGNLNGVSEKLRVSILAQINYMFGSYEMFKLSQYLYDIYQFDKKMAYEIYLYKKGDTMTKELAYKQEALKKYIELAREAEGEKIKDFYAIRKVKKNLM